MQVILDSLFARPGSALIWGGRKESTGTGLECEQQNTHRKYVNIHNTHNLVEQFHVQLCNG